MWSNHVLLQNLEGVRIPFTPRRTVYVVGDAAENPPKRGARIQGVLVHRSKQDAPSVMAPKDLGQFTKVAVGSVTHRQFMRLHTDFSKCRLALEVMFEGIDARQDLGGVEILDEPSSAPLPLQCVCVVSSGTVLFFLYPLPDEGMGASCCKQGPLSE